MKRLRDYLTIEKIDAGEGLFTELSTRELGFTFDGKTIDLAYLAHSGGKPVTEFFQELGKNYLVDFWSKTADILVSLYGEQWKRLYADLTPGEYSPIENYRANETETTQHNVTNTVNRSGSDTNATTYGQTSHTDATGIENYYGFDSETGKPKRDTDTDTDTRLGGTDSTTVTHNTQDSAVDSGYHSRTLLRFGNIGVTTSAQMLEGDAEFWSNFKFFEKLFKDADSLICMRKF